MYSNTNNNLLVKVLQKLEKDFDGKAEDELTTTKFFLDSKDGYKTLNAKMMQAYPVILECVKTISPAKEQWAVLSEPQKGTYMSTTFPKGSVPLFKNLEIFFVSFKALFYDLH